MLDDLTTSWIDGCPSPPRAAVSRELIDPATEEPFHAVHDASPQDVDAAARGAQRAWESGWRDLPPGARSDLLRRLADLIEAHAAELGALDSRSMGKPIAAARGEAQMGARTFRYYAGALAMPHGDVIP